MALSGGMIAGAAAIKTEIENGPTRMLSAVDADWWILQKGSDNAITSSYVDREVVDRLAGDLTGVVGIVRDFRKVSAPNAPPHEAMVFGIYAPGGPSARGAVLDANLARDLSVEVGDSISIADRRIEVSGTSGGLSSIGKEGVVVDYSELADLVPADMVSMIAITGDKPPVWVDDSLAVYSDDEFKALNRTYWRENASGLAVTLIQAIGLFGSLVVGVSIAGRLRGERRLLATLRAVGASRFQIAKSEVGFICAVHVLSLPLQVAVGVGVVTMAAGSTPGFGGTLQISSVLLGATSTLAISLVVGSFMLMWFDQRGLRPLALALREDLI